MERKASKKLKINFNGTILIFRFFRLLFFDTSTLEVCIFKYCCWQTHNILFTLEQTWSIKRIFIWLERKLVYTWVSNVNDIRIIYNQLILIWLFFFLLLFVERILLWLGSCMEGFTIFWKFNLSTCWKLRRLEAIQRQNDAWG